MLQRPARAAASALLAALLASGCAEDPPVVLGISTSGAYMDAARLALAHAREDGLDVPVDTLMIAEATNLGVPALLAAETFVGTPGMVAVLGHSNSGASMAASPLYNQARVLQIAPTASAPPYAGAGPYSFRMVPSDDRQGEFLARAVAESVQPGGRVAIAYVNDEYGRGLRTAVQEALNRRSVESVIELPFLESAVAPAELEGTAALLAHSRPDVLVWLGRGSTLRRMIGPLREALGSVPILGGDAVASVGAGSEDEPSWESVRYVEFGELGGTPEARRFRRDYAARYQRPPTVAAALSYDAMRILLAGVAAGARSGDEMRDYLASLGRTRPPHPGATGPVSFDSLGNVEREYRLVAVGSVAR